MGDYTLKALNLQHPAPAGLLAEQFASGKKKHSQLNEPHSHGMGAAFEDPKWSLVGCSMHVASGWSAARSSWSVHEVARAW
jgi:hypothetical protein